MPRATLVARDTSMNETDTDYLIDCWVPARPPPPKTSLEDVLVKEAKMVPAPFYLGSRH